MAYDPEEGFAEEVAMRYFVIHQGFDVNDVVKICLEYAKERKEREAQSKAVPETEGTAPR